MTTWFTLAHMTDELEKLAKKRKEQLSADDRDARDRAGGALMVAGALPAHRGAAGVLGHAAHTGAEAAADPKLTRGMLRRSKIKHHFKPSALTEEAHAIPEKMFPEFIKKKVERAAKKPGVEGAQGRALKKSMREGVHLSGRMSAAPEIAAHELGHMEIGKTRAGRLLQNIPTALALRAAPVAGLAAGGIAGAASDPDSERAARMAAAVPLAASAPGMTYEGLAHAKGIKHMRRAGLKPGQIAKKLVRTSLPAYMTYATLPVAGAAAAYGGTKGIQAWRRQRKRGKAEGRRARREEAQALRELQG
jgi:hypothetical protein